MTDIPQNARRARQLYEQGVPTREIMTRTGLSKGSLYHWIAGGPNTRGVPALPALPKRRGVKQPRMPKVERANLVTRMMRAAERQVRDIENRLAESGQAPGESERDARTLAVLARTLQSLAALDARHEPKAGPFRKKPLFDDEADQDRIPASIDALREELSRKLAGMAAGHAGRLSREAFE